MTVGNNRIIFAPYNTFYSQLDVRIPLLVLAVTFIDPSAYIQTALIKTGLKENLWNSPMDYTRARAASLSIARRDRLQSRTAAEEKGMRGPTLLFLMQL